MGVQQMRAYARRPDEGEAHWVVGGLYSYRAIGAENGNAYTLVEVHGRGGFAAPMHVHEHEEEGFYVVEGEVTVVIGGEATRLPAGAFAFAPRGVPHAFRFDSPEAKLLLLVTPGAAGHEALFRAIGQPAETRVVPPPAQEQPDFARMAQIAAVHGTTIVGPPP